ncbi:MBL fold metallo-hydrolase [Natrinema marinum]|uniref:MBL fold metallo-hydrolase n=1 Tax=Natrinema marinum TaxID=2961598 RepID=UPI0020C90448|nr:MBL fold metallo-hydrolase [Natrinema marinum]
MTDRPNTNRPVTEIGSGIYDLTLTREPARYRAFLFDWDVPTLIDCGPAESRDTLLERIDACGVAPERLILTHADHDHVGGFDAVVDRYDPTTWVPDQSRLGTDNDPDRRYGHEDQIGPFTAVHIPGHTEDNHALVAPEYDLAIMGDALIGADWRGLPAGYFVLVEGIYSDDLCAAERNAERLQEYAFDVGLVFHGSSVLADARVKLDAFLDFPNKGEWDD